MTGYAIGQIEHFLVSLPLGVEMLLAVLIGLVVVALLAAWSLAQQ